MNDRFDVVVAGLGAIGSAAVYHLSRRGLKVLGLDQFSPPHSFGSSHGETRVIREAYFEHPSYVPLVQRAYELWSELEKNSEEQLYLKTGGLMIGRPETSVLSGAVRSANENGLQYELLDSAAIAQRFPALQPDPDMAGVLEPRAGILFPEKCVAAHLAGAARFGADLRSGEKLHEWNEDPNGVIIRTAHGTFHAGKLVIASGAWVPGLLPSLKSLFRIERQVLLWFKAAAPDFFTPDQFPIHLWEYEAHKMFYGFPDLGSGVKVAFHHQGEASSALAVDRNIRNADISQMRELLDRYMPEANGTFLRGTVCLYTNTPDGHFIIDRLESSPSVIVASPCSGHGFKFASAIGEAIADLAIDQAPAVDLQLFALSRFAPGARE